MKQRELPPYVQQYRQKLGFTSPLCVPKRPSTAPSPSALIVGTNSSSTQKAPHQIFSTSPPIVSDEVSPQSSLAPFDLAQCYAVQEETDQLKPPLSQSPVDPAVLTDQQKRMKRSRMEEGDERGGAQSSSFKETCIESEAKKLKV